MLSPKANSGEAQDLYLHQDEKLFQMRKAIRLRQDRLQKEMKIQAVSQATLKAMSPREIGKLQKVIFEEWTVEGKQELIEPKAEETTNKMMQGKKLRKNVFS